MQQEVSLRVEEIKRVRSERDRRVIEEKKEKVERIRGHQSRL